jgi:hypothetical protein
VQLIAASDGGPSGFESTTATKRRVRSTTSDEAGHFVIDRLFARSGQLSFFADDRRLYAARTRFLSPLGNMTGGNAIVEVETRPGELLDLGELELKNHALAR